MKMKHYPHGTSGDKVHGKPKPPHVVTAASTRARESKNRGTINVRTLDSHEQRSYPPVKGNKNRD
jgi:hypothetical protein